MALKNSSLWVDVYSCRYVNVSFTLVSSVFKIDKAGNRVGLILGIDHKDSKKKLFIVKETEFRYSNKRRFDLDSLKPETVYQFAGKMQRRSKIPDGFGFQTFDVEHNFFLGYKTSSFKPLKISKF